MSSTPSPYSSPPVSPEKSLQVPPQIICEGALGAMPLRWKNPMEENKELERNFNNAVFSFNTDQFTLQKRLENQVGFFSICRVFVFLNMQPKFNVRKGSLPNFSFNIKQIKLLCPRNQEKTIGFSNSSQLIHLTSVNPIQPGVAFLYPLKTENL